MSKQDGIRRCAEWLKACLELGWTRADLDFLEVLWWRYHDANGDLIAASGAPPQQEK